MTYKGFQIIKLDNGNFKIPAVAGVFTYLTDRSVYVAVTIEEAHAKIDDVIKEATGDTDYRLRG